MNNKSNVQGNQNIVIQGITDSTITVNVNGEIEEIVNKLDALHALLEKQQVQTFQTADKIYNISALSEGSFGFITGKKAFNEELTKELISAIQENCVPAQRFLEKVNQIPDWEKQVRISNKAKEIIAYSFVGVIGVQLSKLMAIGKEDLSESKQRKYIEKSLQIAKRCLDLVCFALLSKFWDKQKENQQSISEAHHKVLTQFFHNSFELSIQEQLFLLKTLIDLFEEKQFPLSELENFKECLEEQHEFYKVCQLLQTLNENLDKTEVGLLDCFDAEAHLSVFLKHFRFLANYNMVSIKRIGYEQARNTDPHYLHRFAALGIDSKANVDAEKMIYTPETADTNSVLLFKGKDYQKNVNLFPFVIDYNALTFEHGAKICFYRSNNISDESLEYLFLEDNSINFIEHKAILDSDVEYNELMMDDEKRKIVNLDSVVSQFREARDCILGNSSNKSNEPDFSDLFDEETPS